MEVTSDLELVQDDFELTEKSISVKDVTLPYVLKDKIIFSPGNHNNMVYTENVIKKGFYNTQWNDRTLSLYHAHKDEFIHDPKTNRDKHVGAEVDDLAGYVSNINYLNGGVIKGDINITDLNTAIKLMLGARIGVSPRGIHPRNQPGDNILKDMIVQNWALTVNPAQKTTFLSEVEVSAFAMSESPNFKSKEVNNMSDEEKTREEEIKEEGASKTAEEQLKELQTKHDSLLAEVEELKKKTEYPEKKKEEEKLAKKKEEEEEELAKKKKDEEEKEKYPEDEKQSEELDEEVMDLLNGMETEELSSWKELVKKVGIKEAAKQYKKEKETTKASEQSNELKKLGESVEKLKEELKERSLSPEIISPSNLPIKEGEEFNLKEHQLDEAMGYYLKSIAGV